MGRRFITARDVDDVVAAGRRELRLDAGDRLTDLARERARDRDVALVEVASDAGQATPAPAATPQASPAPPAPRHAPPGPTSTPRPTAAAPPATAREQPTGPGVEAASASDGHPPRRQLRAAVRAGVVEEFGVTPPGLDAAIGRVFDRLGIRD